jgi:hypothetical protein
VFNTVAKRWAIACLLMLTASMAVAVGPAKSSRFDPESGQVIDGLAGVSSDTQLSLVIPVFDPGLEGELPRKYRKDEKRGVVFNEVRRAEANLLAIDLRDVFRESGLFEKVRVVPTDAAIGELYLLGRILRSTSEDLHLGVTLVDISQRNWLEKTYEVRVDDDDVSEAARLRKVDPYRALHEEIVADVAAALAARKDDELRELKGIADMVFAASYSEEAFGGYLGEREIKVRDEDGYVRRVTVTALRGRPAANDPQYQRIQAVRTREELFLDDLQQHYDEFAGRIEPAYQEWQTDAYPIAVEARETRAKSTRKKVFAGLLAAAGVAVGSEANELKTAALAGSGVLAYGAYRSTREYKAISESLSELGDSVDIQLAPTNVEFEGRTDTLQGDAARQYQQMRRFLYSVYTEEQTPDVQLQVQPTP